MSVKKEYLGGGLYANFDGYQFVLTAKDGVSVQNVVYLELSVVEAFKRYVDKVLVEAQNV